MCAQTSRQTGGRGLARNLKWHESTCAPGSVSRQYNRKGLGVRRYNPRWYNPRHPRQAVQPYVGAVREKKSIMQLIHATMYMQLIHASERGLVSAKSGGDRVSRQHTKTKRAAGCRHWAVLGVRSSMHTQQRRPVGQSVSDSNMLLASGTLTVDV